MNLLKALKSLFGPTRKEVWRQLSSELDGRFHEGGMFSQSAVQARSGDWTITLDTFTTGDGKSNQTYTRLRAPWFNPDGFRFTVYRASVFSGVGKALGMQDVEVGYPRFDRDFVIKGTSAGRLRQLFDNRRVRHLIDAQRRVHLSVKGRDGWFGKYPPGMDELHFQALGVIKDLPRLRHLFELFTEVLWQLCYGGRVEEDDVRFHIRRLGAPGGRITDKYVLWQGDEPRRAAAVALGRIGDPAAVPALADVLRDEDSVLRVRAIEALAEIPHRDATAPLIALLGDGSQAAGRRVRDGVADALRQRGEGSLVDAVLAALAGDVEPLRAWGGEYRTEIIEALGHALDGRSGGPAADALAEIKAVEALPRLREVGRSTRAESRRGLAISRAIRELEARAALPRAASAADVDTDTLPRSAPEPS